MNRSDKDFVGSIPELYDRYLVPLIFQSYADDLAQRVAALAPRTVLEIAAGSGVVARALAPRLGAHAHYTVTDLNQPMLDHAARRQGPDPRLTWRQADAQDLPFDDAAFDAVLCQFGVMFFPDRDAAYRQVRRILAPGGSFVFNVWDAIEHNVFARIVTAAAAEVFPHDPPRFLERTPHGYHDLAAIRRELLAAGFSRIDADTVAATSSAPSPRHPAIAYCQGTPLRNEIEARAADRLEEVTERAAQAIAAAYGDGTVSAEIRGHILVATA